MRVALVELEDVDETEIQLAQGGRILSEQAPQLPGGNGHGHYHLRVASLSGRRTRGGYHAPCANSKQGPRCIDPVSVPFRNGDDLDASHPEPADTFHEAIRCASGRERDSPIATPVIMKACPHSSTRRSTWRDSRSNCGGACPPSRSSNW